MSFGNIIGQILQQGMASQSPSRLEHTLGPSGLGGVGGGLGDLLGSVLGAGGGRAGGGLGDVLGAVLGGQGAGRSAGGGLGDLLGGLLGGGSAGGQAAAGTGGGLGDLLGGALGGGAARGSGSSNPLGGTGMAILATLAMAALKNWQDSRGAATAAGLTDAAAMAPGQFAEMTAPETEKLVLRAMISAAKADGQVDEDEIQRIVGRIGEDGVTPDEKQFVAEELRRPLDLQGLIDAVPNEAVAAQVYGASLLAIRLDTDAELAYLQQLARGLGLDAGTVARLHQLTGTQG
ncbi:tellurite resistance TerB family protein [Thauera sinica]|uniref:Tellurite resistance TerB family protein n=1 Tax=Thauera sinica TaxID=2665146 RepID=A0ABW1AQX9_9RHOO|nr:tellurite resistance TerB family protein [Thauera sp. K11]ATE59737.1 protein YebE [Thauera sp. K11]